jgi:hypothetical protein
MMLLQCEYARTRALFLRVCEDTRSLSCIVTNRTSHRAHMHIALQKETENDLVSICLTWYWLDISDVGFYVTIGGLFSRECT